MNVKEVEAYIGKRVEVTFTTGSKATGCLWRDFSREYEKNCLLLVFDVIPFDEFRLWPHKIKSISEIKGSE